MHLNPLVFVVDTGWNLNVAVENIEKIVKGLNLDMFTEVVNWKEMADLQLSFFKASIICPRAGSARSSEGFGGMVPTGSMSRGFSPTL